MASEINEAVELAHRSGILSAASLMVGGRAAADAVSLARRLPTLRVGLHIVVVDGAPILPPDRIPGLVDRAGRLRCDLVRMSIALAILPSRRRQLRAEIVAQFEAYRRTGLPLDHVDVHRHFHLHPLVAREIIAVGRQFGMRALRVPAESSALVMRIGEGGRVLLLWLLRPWLALLRAQARRAGLLMADTVFGLSWSGAVSAKRLVRLLASLPPGLTEIYTHPSVTNRFAGHAEGYRYTEELNALRAPVVAAALRASGLQLGSYADACAGEPAQEGAPDPIYL
jgi:hopanoid biosynthesis associated protein HpnK